MGLVDEVYSGSSLVDSVYSQPTPGAKKLADATGGGVWDAVKKRGGEAYRSLTRPFEDPLSTTVKALGGTAIATGGLVNDLVGMAIPDAAKSLGKELLEPIAQQPAVKYLQNKAGEILKNNPQLATDVQALTDASGLLMVPGMARGAKALVPAAKEGMNIGADLLSLATKKTAAELESKAASVIEKGIDKGIRPTVVGKRDAGQIAKYYDNAKTAVKAIINEFPDKLPKDLDEFSTVIRDTKKKIYEKYSGLSSAAGEAGVLTDLTGARSELAGIIGAPNTPVSVKVAARKALREISTYDQAVTPAVAEDLVAHINTLTKSFWNNPNPSDATYTTMLERVARNVRKSTGEAIDSLGDNKYGDLKKAYGSLSAIEKDVAHRSIVDARKNAKGIFDLADVATAAEFTAGLLSMNPAALTKAGAMEATKRYIKGQNNPNAIIRKMFEKTKDLAETSPDELKSRTMRTAKEMMDLTGEKKGRPLPPSIDAPLENPPVISTAIRLPRDVSADNQNAIMQAIEQKRAAMQSANLPVARQRTINLPRDVSQSTALDELVAKKLSAPARTVLNQERQAGPAIIEGPARQPGTIPSAVDYDRVILPAIMEANKGKLPTWVEDRLNHLRTVSPSSWTADDQLLIRRLTAEMNGEKAAVGGLVKPPSGFMGGTGIPRDVPSGEVPPGVMIERNLAKAKQIDRAPTVPQGTPLGDLIRNKPAEVGKITGKELPAMPSERAAQILGAQKKTPSAENAQTFLERQGGINWGEDYNLKQMKQDKDAKSLARSAGMAPDEAAQLLNDAGIKHPDGQPWDGDRLAEAAKSGQLRKSFTPEKSDVKMNQLVKKLEAEYESQFEGLSTEELNALSHEDKSNIKGLSIDEIASEAGDLTESEIAFAQRDADDFFFGKNVKEDLPGYSTKGEGLGFETTPSARGPIEEIPMPAWSIKPLKGELKIENPSLGFGPEPPSAKIGKDHTDIINGINDKPWKWRAEELAETPLSKIDDKLNKIWGPEEEFDLWAAGGGSDKKRFYVLADNAGDLDRAVNRRDIDEIRYLLNDIQSRLQPQDYYAYEEAKLRTSGGRSGSPSYERNKAGEQISPTRRAVTSPSSYSLPGLSAAEDFQLARQKYPLRQKFSNLIEGGN